MKYCYFLGSRYYWIVFIILLNLPIQMVFADSGKFAENGFMNGLLNELLGKTSIWKTIFVPAATSLFLFLSCTEFAYDTGIRLLRGGEAGKMLAFAVLRMITISLFLFFIRNVDWIFQILDQYKIWASSASGLSKNLGPSDIASIGVSISSSFFENVLKRFPDMFIATAILFGFVALITGFAIMVAFAWAGLQLLCIYVEFFLVINAGLINLGFLGSSWTRDMGKKYIIYILAVGTKLLVAFLIIDAVIHQTEKWAQQFVVNNVDWNSLLNLSCHYFVGSIIIAVLVSSIPAYAASIIMGVSMGNANQVASTGASLMNGVATGGLSVASSAMMMYGSAKGAVGAASKAYSDYKNRPSGASSNMAPSGGSSITNMAKNNSFSDGASSMQRGISAIGIAKKSASSTHKHWSSVQADNYVAPPDLHDKDSQL